MHRIFLFFLCVLFLITKLNAQGENNVWTFGHNNGLDFNTTPPSFFQTSSVSVEGSASVSDASGNLLFYSNGNDVWTATGAVMPNGSGILGNGAWMLNNVPILGSCAQGVAIVKSVSNSNQYYLFTLDAAEQILTNTTPGYLRYSVIDMSLNGGNGDVLATQKNIIVDSFMTEKMTVTKGAGCYYWLLAHKHNSPAFRAFKIDGNGVQPPVTSNGAWQGSVAAGQLKITPDGTKFAHPYIGGVELGLFDNATGMVSNAVIMDTASGPQYTGCCFSPDGTKLYTAAYNSHLAQYDLTTYPNTAAVLASRVLLFAPYQFSNLRNGPDGKIYISFFQNHPYLGTINFPNLAGIACGVNHTALPQSSWSTFQSIPGFPYGHGLGNDFVVGMNIDTTYGIVKDTVLCFEESLNVTASSGFGDYLWSDGLTTPTRTLSVDGVYKVYGYGNCEVSIDSFDVKFINFDVTLGNDTAICPNGNLTLNATVAGANYTWQDNSTDAIYDVQQAGSYHVKVTFEGCTASDTVLVTTLAPFMKIPQQDTLICDDDVLVIHAEASPVSSCQWSNGSSEDRITINQAGTYIVTATNACGTFVDSMTLAVENCDCRTFIPTAFSPNQDGNNDVFLIHAACLVSDYSFSVYNRYGQRLFQSSDIAKGWDGNHNGTPVDVGTYFYYIKFKGPRGDAFEQKGDLVLVR